MGQHSPWHLQHLNQYISFVNNTIQSTSSISHGIGSNYGLNNNRSSLSLSSTETVASTARDSLGSVVHQQVNNASNAIAEKLSNEIQLASIMATATTKSTHDAISAIDDDTVIWSNWLLPLIVLYCIVVIGGVFGNASLIITLYTQSSARLRNPLLVALCSADLMVTGVAAPLTIVTFVIIIRNTVSSAFICKTIYFMQSVPVAASTISLLMLSLDRYATVKNPRLAQLRQRRSLPDVLAFASWISAIIVSVPILIAYKITVTHPLSSSMLTPRPPMTNHTIITTRPTSSNPTTSTTTTIITATAFVDTNSITEHNFSQLIEETAATAATTTCQADYGTAHMHNLFFALYTLFVFILPGIGVVMNHLGVRQKLCALSLTARAAHGELPLPMPILRRPTHMIIVTGMANAAAVRGDDDDSTNDEDNQQKEERRYMVDSTRLKPTPRTPRSLRYDHSIRNHMNNQKNVPPSELPLPQTSTLRSRRRLANMLVASSFVFVFCWAPHIICLIWSKLTATEVCSKAVTSYCLLLGYTHSALNPILHWALNHNSLRQSSFLLRLTTVQRFLRTHLRDRNHQPPPSSTNEAALGPFNPRYIKARPQQQYHAPPASSHFLY